MTSSKTFRTTPRKTLNHLSIASFISLSITLLITLGGCAGEKPIVDTRGVSPVQYEQDVSECTEYADQVEMGSKAAVGAVTGAAVGAALGGIWDGYRGASVERGARFIVDNQGADGGWYDEEFHPSGIEITAHLIQDALIADGNAGSQ